jgi:hypothetical protein
MKQRVLADIEIASVFILDFPNSRIVRKCIPIMYKILNPKYFLKAAQTD